MWIALTDDQAADRAAMEQLLREYAAIHDLECRIAHFSSGDALLSAYQPYRYAMIFLDIFMEGTDGVETAKEIRNLDPDAVIIFLTTSDEHRPDAFSLFAAGYLTKPCERETVFRLLDHVLHLRTKQERRFSFSFERQEYSLRLSELLSLESRRNYLEIRTADGKSYRTRMTISAAEEALDNRFLELTRGVIVNMDAILSIERGVCRLRGGIQFPINLRKEKELRETWTHYKFAAIRNRMTAGGGAP